jgi:hypothetical protein
VDAFLPHEQPLYLVLPRGTTAGTALERVLARPEVKAYALPTPWFLEPAGVDLLAALPELRSITAQNVGRVLEAAERLCTRPVLEERSRQLWHEADERVRQHFLKRTMAQVIAGLFRVGPRSNTLPPTEEFVADRIHEHRFEVQYRIAPERGGEEYPAPPEEGSVVAYPFDLKNDVARRELNLDRDSGHILEVFAYVWQHDRHRALWQSVAADLGARLMP